jgi:hypothetical protein
MRAIFTLVQSIFKLTTITQVKYARTTTFSTSGASKGTEHTSAPASTEFT